MAVMNSLKSSFLLFRNRNGFNVVNWTMNIQNVRAVGTSALKVLPNSFPVEKCNFSIDSFAERETDILKNEFYTTKSKQEALLLEVVKSDKPLHSDEINEIKSKVINEGKCINNENIDAVFLALCIGSNAFTVGRSYFLDLIQSNTYNLASVGKFFHLCFKCREICIQADKELIVNLYRKLITKYNIIDCNTCENAVLGLSITPAWKEAYSLIEMCKLTSEPTSKMFDALIQAAFTNGDSKFGWLLMEEALQNGKTLACDTFAKCLLYEKNKDIHFLIEILRKYNILISSDIADLFIDHYKNLFPNAIAKITPIAKKGRCLNCSRTLQPIHLSVNEFEELKEQFLSPVLIGKNIFLKTEPTELNSFLDFIKTVGKVDVVLDGLNVAYAVGMKNRNTNIASQMLCKVVKHFTKMDQKVLIIGRKHMNKWPEKNMSIIRRNSLLFLTDNVSTDDPFLLYATINSGLGTIFISRDQMRSHKFLLKDPKLRRIFDKWQQKHQYYLKHLTADGRVLLEYPLPYLQSIQRNIDGTWHLPLRCTSDAKSGVPAHLLPQVTSWLCLS